jgi:CRP-like cAMP-binding protein
MRMASRAFAKGAALYRQRVTATGFYLVESGSVRVQLLLRNQAHLVEIVGAGAVLGLPETVPGRHIERRLKRKSRRPPVF